MRTVEYKRLEDLLPFMSDPNRTAPSIPDDLMRLHLIDPSLARDKVPFVPASLKESKVALRSLANHLGIIYRGVYKNTHGKHDIALREVTKSLLPEVAGYLAEPVQDLASLVGMPSLNLPNHEQLREIRAHPTAGLVLAKFIVARESHVAGWSGEHAVANPRKYQARLAGAVGLVGAYDQRLYVQELNQAMHNAVSRARFWRAELNGLEGNPLVEAVIEREIERQRVESILEERAMQMAEMVE